VTATATTDLREVAQKEYPELRIEPELADVGGPQIVALKSPDGTAKPERVPAFSINGITYSINVRPLTNAGLRYVHLARTKGNEHAIDFMLTTLLGEEGYEALMDYDDLTEEDLKAVVEGASKIMAGTLEAPKGKPSKGSRKSRG
jgi:hypothetical protein